MGELCQEFLRQSIANLQLLRQEAGRDSACSDDFLRRVFRQLHTIKGTSRTFDLEHLAYFAHQVENLVQAVQKDRTAADAETYPLFRQCLERLSHLAESCLNGTAQSSPDDLIERINQFLPDRPPSPPETISGHIPAKFASQLSTREKSDLAASLQNGDSFYLLEIFFDLLSFDIEFKRFKGTLEQHGKVIAVAPAEAKINGQIGFRLFFTAPHRRTAVESLIREFSAQIVHENSPVAKSVAKNLSGFLANLVADGEKIARILEKQVSFETLSRVSGDTTTHLVLLHEIASHLLHNAIDHGIETVAERLSSGKNPTARIEICVSVDGHTLVLQIRDDGRGIDTDEVLRRARDLGLFRATVPAAAEQALEVIFAQGFTTSRTVSEISGRGVGLDAVRDLVDKAGGRITVETRPGTGTSFLVYLPLN